ncbi:hypothetical protein J2X47_002005 [Sphingomonas sp. BE270]|jgi:hypothetical protein|nr:hypothetical protein [Sphingomonas sp. BE270]MDR7257825.1 hypothetical protein [Sphingomonas sp. BE270]
MSAHDLYGYAVGCLFAVALAAAGTVIGTSLAMAWDWYKTGGRS